MSDKDYDEPFNKYEEECNNNKKNTLKPLHIHNPQQNTIKSYMIFKRSSFNKNKIIEFIQKKIRNNRKNKQLKDSNIYKTLLKKYNEEEKNYFKNLNKKEKKKIYNIENTISKRNGIDEPLRFKFLRLDIDIKTKNYILSKLEELERSNIEASNYHKLFNWINTLSKIPFGKYHNLGLLNNQNNKEKISLYLNNIKDNINKYIYGHEETTEQFIRIIAQWINKPDSKGYAIGIQGSAGVGKTKIIKDCISKVLNIPFSLISLGGISDSSYLKGSSYTYEGSIYGKICESLIRSEIMNPIILFDELDKVSRCNKGDEIINTLIHITDPVQNDKYTDRYFEEIDLDISKSLLIFTYNDEKLINPILKDRLIKINVKGYNIEDKIKICNNYILPELLENFNLKKDDITIDNDLLHYIVKTNEDDGVRTLKYIINNIISFINLLIYIPKYDIEITYPYNVNLKFYKKYYEKINNTTNKTNNNINSIYT